MKLFQLAVLAAAVSLGGSVFAQAPDNPGKGLTITRITGTVNIMKNGVVIMTLKPGDAIPEIMDNKMSFAVVAGSMEIQASGKTITAGAGSNFTVTAAHGDLNVALGGGAPVAIKSESGHNVVLTPNSEVKMVNTGGKLEVTIEKGRAVVSNADGGETRSMKAGETFSMPSVPAPAVTPAAPAPAKPAAAPAAVEEPKAALPAFEPPPTTVIPTQTVEEALEVSGSNP